MYIFDDLSPVRPVIIPKKTYEGPSSKNQRVYEDFTLEELEVLRSPPRKRRASSESIVCAGCVNKQQNIEYFKHRTNFFSDKCLALTRIKSIPIPTDSV